jgi:hypothetical protein
MANQELINSQNWEDLSRSFFYSTPFNHVVIDNFFKQEVALNIFNDMPDYNLETLDAKYDNPIEKKRTLQNWTKFPKNLYSATTYLVSEKFNNYLKELSRQHKLQPDYGLHGGGVHMHQAGDYLNIHVDYDIHPKLGMKRKLNLIVYLTPNWKEEWGGCLELWSNDEETNQPKECIKKIIPFFNRAIIFDTTQNSWHGVPGPINPPSGTFRKSLALYYVIPTEDISKRGKALFTPREDQKDDQEILNFIKKRAEL